MGKKIIWIGCIVLFVLHQDVWLWDDPGLVFGFMPKGLAYHATFSIAAACLWACALKFAWPHELEKWADEVEESEKS